MPLNVVPHQSRCRRAASIATCVLAGVLCASVLPARADPGPAVQLARATPLASPSPIQPTTAAVSPVSAAPAASSSVRGVTRCAADLGLGVSLAGRVAEMRVREGQIVRAGDVLLRLDQRAEELDVERRHVQWQGTAEMTIAQARQETALAQVQAARRIYQQSQGISREELDNRELAYANAVAEIRRIKTAKEMERLDYLTAKENLDRRTLRAPKAGIVTRLIKSSGESVQAHEPALRLCDLSSIQAVVNVPAQASEQLREGASVSLKVGQPPKPTQGRLTFVSPVIDSASGLREVKIDLIHPGADVRPGAPVSLELPH